jgi:hypothetical protein
VASTHIRLSRGTYNALAALVRRWDEAADRSPAWDPDRGVTFDAAVRRLVGLYERHRVRRSRSRRSRPLKGGR